MIVIHKLTFSNWFSFGENQEIIFDDDKLLQLIGHNGAGKSSIPLILEEVLFNKNSKGIDKKSLINRNNGAKKACAEALLFINSKELRVSLERTATTSKVSILLDGEDISGHTATQSYKVIEDLLGLDHKAFTQLIYQSSTSSLDFLTATDTNRKKFLLQLLSLEHYSEALEKVKAEEKSAKSVLDTLQGKLSVYTADKVKYGKFIDEAKSLEDVDVIPVPEDNSESIMQEIAELKARLGNITQHNARITKNRQSKKALLDLEAKLALAKKDLDNFTVDDTEVEEVTVPDTTEVVKAKTEAELTKKRQEAYVAKVSSLGCQCPTCSQAITEEFKESLLVDARADITKAIEAIEVSKPIIAEAELLSKKATQVAELKRKRLKQENDYAKLKLTIESLEREIETVKGTIDYSMEDTHSDASRIEGDIKALELKLKANNNAIADALEHNRDVSHRNTKLAFARDKLVEVAREYELVESEVKEASSFLAKLSVLAKTLSTNGLPAYEIENRVGDLEAVCNTYLQTLSDGRFSISLALAGDKLPVIINDNGHSVGIESLSSGEKARVNTAMLLAIRKLMSGLSKSQVNLLILDETIENLDVTGKELLVEILLAEDKLNTVLISHGFSHPLLNKLTVEKVKGVSSVSR
jgi:DNA repair exonuclease SbcCD ATPase subunit